MTFIEEYRALLQAVKDFDDQSIDLTTLSDSDLRELETSRLPLYSLHEQAYKERLRRCEIEKAEWQKREEKLRERYGYARPGEDISHGLTLMTIRAEEKGLISASYRLLPALGYSDAEIRAEIRKDIPTISDEEIDEYRKAVTG